MKSIIALLAAAVLASPAIASDSSDKDCFDWTQQIVHGDSAACSDLCPQALQFDKYHYAKGLKSAFVSRKGLSQFIAYTGRSSIIGAGADAQACNLHALLARWGDQPFAQVTGKYRLKTREHVIGLLDYAAVQNFKTTYPRTYALATHVE